MQRTRRTATGVRAGCGSDHEPSSPPRARSSNIGPARIRCVAHRPDRANPHAELRYGTPDVVPRRTRL